MTEKDFDISFIADLALPLYPFEAALDDILKDADRCIDDVFASLQSEFLLMPKGEGFILEII